MKEHTHSFAGGLVTLAGGLVLAGLIALGIGDEAEPGVLAGLLGCAGGRDAVAAAPFTLAPNALEDRHTDHRHRDDDDFHGRACTTPSAVLPSSVGRRRGVTPQRMRAITPRAVATAAQANSRCAIPVSMVSPDALRTANRRPSGGLETPDVPSRRGRTVRNLAAIGRPLGQRANAFGALHFAGEFTRPLLAGRNRVESALFQVRSRVLARRGDVRR